jgi:hypothetical protein
VAAASMAIRQASDGGLNPMHRVGRFISHLLQEEFERRLAW